MQECPFLPVWPELVYYQGIQIKDGHSFMVVKPLPAFLFAYWHDTSKYHPDVSNDTLIYILVVGTLRPAR